MKLFVILNIIDSYCTIDILMIFLLTHAILKQLPIFTWDRVLFGLGYGVTLGIAAYFLDGYTSNSLDCL
jgi:hypothetical protein